MAPIKFGVGQSVLRKEDDALIRGKGRYTDDHAPQPALHALVLRSPHAHAKFTINAARARGLPGVGADPDGGGRQGSRRSALPVQSRSRSLHRSALSDPRRGRGAPCRRRRRLRGRRHHRSCARRDRGDRGQLDAAAGGDRRRQRGEEGRAAGLARAIPATCCSTCRSATRRPTEAAFAKAHAVAEISDRQSARHHQLHGNPRGGLRIRRQARSSDADGRQPGQPSPARNPVRDGAEDPAWKRCG